MIKDVPAEIMAIISGSIWTKPFYDVGVCDFYERIAVDLRARLHAGEFSPDAPLPSEAELVAEYQVSRNTVRRAYRELVETGAVRHGAGAFPAPR